MNKDSVYKENQKLKKELADTRSELDRLKKMSGVWDDDDVESLWTDMKSGYWEWNGNSELPLASSALQKMLGYTKGKLSKDYWREHIFSSDLTRMFEAFEKHRESNGRIPFDVKLRFRHKDGHTIHIWGFGRIVDWNKNGAPSRVIGSVIEITDLLKERAAHRDIREQLDLVVAGSGAALWDWKLKEDMLWWSEKHYELMGYAPGEITPDFDSFYSHVHPEDTGALKQALEEHFEKKKPFKIELRLIRKDGMIWVESSGQAIFDNNGKPGRFSGGLVDISSRKDLEMQLRNQNMIFRHAEEMARLGGWEINLETGKVTMTEEIYKIREFPKGSEWTLETVTKNDPPESQKIMKESLVQATKGEPYEHEIEIQTYTGKRVWVKSKGEPVRNEEGKIIAIKGVMQDINDQKRKEIELNKIREKLNDQLVLFQEAERVAQMGSWHYDITTGQVLWSENTYKIRGIPPDFDPSLHSVLESYIGDSGEKLKKAIEAAIAEGKDYEFDLQMKRYSGEVIWVKVKGVPVKKEGKITGLRGIIQNIDKYKKQEEELRKTEYLYSEAARIGRVGAWEIDAKTNEVTWSKEIYSILKVPPEHKPTLEEAINLYTPESQEILKRTLDDVTETGESFSLELKIIRYDKAEVWVRVEGSPVFDNEKNLRAYRGSTHDIDELKRREIHMAKLNRELRETEQLYSEAARIGKVGAWKFNVKTNELTWSREIYNILSYPYSFQPSLEQGLNLYKPGDKELVAEAIRNSVEKGESFSLELELTTADNREIWAKVQASAVYDEEGEMATIRGNFQDITERKHREIHWEELNWELSHQRNILLQAEEIAQLGSWSFWFKDESYSLSDQVRRIHEVPDVAEVDLKREVAHYYRNYLDEIQLLVERVKNGQSYQFDAYITTYKEHEKWVRVKGSPLRSSNGKIEGFTGIVQDIHSFKKKEEELQETRDQLNTQNHILQEAKRMAKIGSWQWNTVTKRLRWSDQLRMIYEVPADFQPDLRYSFSTFYDKESAEYLKQCIKRAIEEQISYDFQTEIITYKKQRKWVRIKGSPMYEESGKLTGVFGTVQDINDIKEKELQILKTSDLIAEQNNRLMDFTQIVSHNLRSHSSNIQTMLNFVKKCDTKEEQETYYEYIKETADSLQQAIGHLNEVVKIQKDVGLQKTNVNIEDTLHKVLNILEGDIRLYDVKVSFDLKVTELRYVKAYLDSILLNLLSNAIKYRHPKRSSKISISTFYNEDGRPVLEVHDNGQGIDLEKHGDKVFGMYKTFHKHPEARGIGLFIIKNQIEALKGKIEVESERGKWTRFRVKF